MTTSVSKLPDRLPTTFAALSKLHPLRPINDEAELAGAHEIIDRLAVLNKRTRDQNDYLETLSLLAEAFEAAEVADALDPSKSSPVDALNYLMSAHGMNQTALAQLLGVGRSTVSMILSGDRPITADHARTLAEHFNVGAGAFV